MAQGASIARIDTIVGINRIKTPVRAENRKRGKKRKKGMYLIIGLGGSFFFCGATPPPLPPSRVAATGSPLPASCPAACPTAAPSAACLSRVAPRNGGRAADDPRPAWSGSGQFVQFMQQKSRVTSAAETAADCNRQ